MEFNAVLAMTMFFSSPMVTIVAIAVLRNKPPRARAVTRRLIRLVIANERENVNWLSFVC